jgi:hypothetical protein
MYLRTASVIEELFTALAYVDANDMVFVDNQYGTLQQSGDTLNTDEVRAAVAPTIALYLP